MGPLSSCGVRAFRSVSCCRAQPLGSRASVVASHGLQSMGSAVTAHGVSSSVACGIFLDRGSNPCSLRWQVDSSPLYHQGRPGNNFI